MTTTTGTVDCSPHATERPSQAEIPRKAAGSTPLVLGAMFFGTTIDEDTSFALLDRFTERGGSWIDTADCYSFWTSATGQGGDSERLLGRWLAARPGIRDQVQISTKIGAEPLWAGSWPQASAGLSRRAVQAAFAGSLDRLGVDHVDLLWLHKEDRTVPIEQTVDAVGELVAAGTVRRVGASNHPAWRVERARAHAAASGMLPIDALQLNHTYLPIRPGSQHPTVRHRFGVLADEQRDYAAEHGLEVWAYGPLLSGAYDNPAKPIPEVFDHPGTARRLAVLDELTAATGASRGQIVLAWLVAHGIRPILGGSKPYQLEAALDGAALALSAEQLAHLDRAA
jgi:aryl-alcohol dehydrogenase-like predicted oxidoreductase